MPRTDTAIKTSVGLEEWLEFEHNSPEKHEWVDGQLFQMAGGSDRHNRLAVRLAALLEINSECLIYANDMKLVVPAGVGYYPDVMVLCEGEDTPLYKTKPCLLVEVLSDRTEATDRGEKLHNYFTLPSLQAYVLLSQREPRTEIYRREAGRWVYEMFEEGTFRLPCVELEVEMAELYRRLG
jgi:Uma2 family endonuclease